MAVEHHCACTSAAPHHCSAPGMGVKGLAPLLRSSKHLEHTLDDPRLKGQRVGVDASIFLHQCVNRAEGAWQVTAVPKQPVKAVEDVFMSLVRAAAANNRGIQLVFVFDGKRPPSKEAENESRAAKVEAGKRELEELCGQGSNRANLKQVERARKKAATVTEDMVALAVQVLKAAGVEVMGAPFEADWQLAFLEGVGYTQGTITNDTDLFPLGSRLLVTQLEVAGGRCNIVDRADVMGPLGSLSFCNGIERAVGVFCSLLGTDYLPRVGRLVGSSD